MERLSTLSIVADEIGDFLNTDNIFKRFLTLLLFISFEHDKNIHNIDTTLRIDGNLDILVRQPDHFPFLLYILI